MVRFGTRGMAAQTPQQTRLTSFPRRGEIYLVTFDPTVGHEIRKTRPALVVQNDVSNRYSQLTIVAAISSQFDTPSRPREVIIEPDESGLPKVSVVLAGQIRTVDRRRLIKRLGSLSPMSMRRIDDALRISLGLVEF